MSAPGISRRLGRLEAGRAIGQLSDTPMTVADLLAGRFPPGRTLEAIVRESYEIREIVR